MAFVNFATREITAKIVYYGPALGGKTTSLQYIHNSLSPDNRGKMISLATDEDRTIYFDFLPLSLGKIQDFAVRIQLYTVPGQVRYNATRKIVLRGADGVVFVADCQKHKKLANLESFHNMEDNLQELSKALRDLPHTLQFNKIDLPAVLNAEEMNALLNKYNVPFFETCAISGIGVLDALKSITKLVFNDLSKKALLQKKSRTTSMPSPVGFTAAAPLIEEQEEPASFSSPSKSTPVPPPPAPIRDYYGDSVEYKPEIESHAEASFGQIPDHFGTLASEDSTSSTSTFESHSAEQPELEQGPIAYQDRIDEVEPLAEEEDQNLEESAEDRDQDFLSDPSLTEEQAPEEFGSTLDLHTSFSYAKIFDDSFSEFSGLMERLEKQIYAEDHSQAIRTANEIFSRMMSRSFPTEYLIDSGEATKILALNMKFKRFLRFKQLLTATHLESSDLLFIHHFLSDLYLSLKEF